MFQFYRSFPRPPEINEGQVDLIIMKYRDPTRPGLLNYLNLHQDLVRMQHAIATDDRLKSINDITDYLKPQVHILIQSSFFTR